MPVFPPSSASGSGLLIAEADGNPSGTATALVFPNSTLGISSGTATYTPAGAGGGSVVFYDEGNAAGTAAIINVTGSGGTVSVSGGTANIAISAASSGGLPLDSYAIDGTYGDDFTGASLSGSWTRRNYVSGDETYQVGPGGQGLRIAKAGQSAGDGYFRSATSLPDGQYAMKFVPRFTGSLNTFAWGIGVVDSSGSGIASCFYNTPAAPLLVQVTTYSTYGGAYVQPGASGASPNIGILPTAQWWSERPVWVRIRKSGTNWYLAYSFDGFAWSPESSALSWSGTIDRIAMMDAPLGGITSGSGTGSYVDVLWFNKIA